MSNGEQKPPIHLPDTLGGEGSGKEPKLDERGGAGDRSGRLGYMADERPRRPAGGGTPQQSGVNWMGVVAGVVIAVVISGLVMWNMAASKGDVQEVAQGITNLSGQVTTVQQSIDGETQRIDNLINNALPDYARTSDLAGLQNSVNSLSGLSTKVDAKLAELDTKFAELQAEIEELLADIGTPTDGTGGTSDGDTVFLDLRGPSTFIYGINATAPQTFNLLMEVVNETSYDIENVEVEIVLYPRFMSMIDLDTVTIASGSPSFSWQAYIQGSAIIIIGLEPTWGSGLEVGAGDDENVFLTINVSASSLPTSSVYFDIETEVTDYKIAP